MSTGTSAEHGRDIIHLDPDLADRKRKLEDALQQAGQRAADALATRAAVVAEIGELMRRDRAAGNLVGVIAAEYLTGLTRPTLTRARDSQVEAWADIVELARLVRVYGDDRGDQTKLHARRPELAGIWNAAQWLLAQASSETAFDPVGPLDQVGAPGHDLLIEQYYGLVDRLAAGDPY